MKKHLMGRAGALPVLALVAGLVWGHTALAQGAASAAAPATSQPEPDATQQRALACLTKPARPLVYPKEALQRRVGGFIRLRLTFVKPDSPPKVEVLQNTYDPFSEIVTTYARAYRMPCLDAAAPPVVVEQAFSFDEMGTAGDPSLAPQSAAPARTRELMACTQTPKKTLEPPSRMKRGEVFNAIYRLRFTAADKAPELLLLYATEPQGYLDKEARKQLSDYRLPCMTGDDQPVFVVQSFQLVSPEDVWVFKENRMALLPFLRLMRNIRSEKVDFDLKEMACPFTVRWMLGRPAVDNDVVQLGEPDARREPFIAWLRTLTMNLDPQQFEGLLGQRLNIDVPCTRLKLSGNG